MRAKKTGVRSTIAASASAIGMTLSIAGCAGPAPGSEPTGAAEESIEAAAAEALSAGLSPGEISFFDGARRIRAVRTMPRSRGGALSAITLRFDGGRPDVAALVGRGAVVEIEPREAGDDDIKEALSALGVRAVRPLMRAAGLWLVEDEGEGDGLDVAARLALRRGSEAAGTSRARLREAYPDLYLRRRALKDPYVPDDPKFPGQWFFKNLNMPEAWSYTKGDPSVSVVVVDSGCDAKHADIASKMDPGKDVVDGDDDPSFVAGEADNAHGTACAGLIGAVTNNKDGIAGGCPECRLRCVRLLGDMATPVSADIAAFTFALETDAAVVSNSWGFVDPIPVPNGLKTAINTVFDTGRGGKGAVVVFAAGNEARVVGDDEVLGVRGVLGVGAINNLDEETPFTNTGNSVDLVAPTGTSTTDISGADGYDSGDYTGLFGGTSSACPVAASIAALLVSAAPEKTSAEIVDALIKTARPAPYAQPDANGHDQVFGYGIIDPVPALKSVLNIQEPPDAGPIADAGAVPPDTEAPAEGCGCAMPGRSGEAMQGAIAALLGLGVGVMVVQRTRRRRKSA